MSSPRRIYLLFVVVACAGSACGPEPNDLWGSIDQSHDLSFDTVELRLLTGQSVYQLTYMKDLEASETDDVVAKVVFDRPQDGIPLDEKIPFDGDSIVERVTAANDPLPALREGSVTFHEGGSEDQQHTVGEFAATFENGKTLNGNFDTSLRLVDF